MTTTTPPSKQLDRDEQYDTATQLSEPFFSDEESATSEPMNPFGSQNQTSGSYDDPLTQRTKFGGLRYVGKQN